MNEGAVIDMVADTSSESYAFAIATESHEILGGVEVVDALYLLFDDWASIEIFCDVVTGGSDEFYTAVVGLMVGFSSSESGEK